MAIPQPQLGLVLSYAYLWHHEHRRGREEGSKHRPCVIVFAVERAGDDAALVRVVPVTHSPPDDEAVAVELPVAVKRYLGLDTERSWVILAFVDLSVPQPWLGSRPQQLTLREMLFDNGSCFSGR